MTAKWHDVKHKQINHLPTIYEQIQD